MYSYVILYDIQLIVYSSIPGLLHTCVRAVASSHRLADTVKGSQLSYMTPAMQREAMHVQIANDTCRGGAGRP